MTTPSWLDDKKINETLFCEMFLQEHPMVSVGGSFFTVDGKIHDETRLRKTIYNEIKPYVTTGIAKKVTNLLDVLRMECCVDGLPLHEDRIHVANGTLYLDGTFTPDKDFCRNHLPVAYNPEAPEPVKWLDFLKANQQEKISFRMDDIRKYFPRSYTPARIQERILKLVEADFRKRQRSREER